jgi:hypothetical protein
MVDYEEESVEALDPEADDLDLVMELLAHGYPVLSPAVATATESMSVGMSMVAASLSDPRTLRTPRAAMRTLEGLRGVVLATAAAVNAVGQSVAWSLENNEVGGRWEVLDTVALATVASQLRHTLAALRDVAAVTGELRYIGPSFASETERTRALAAELRRRGASVTYDPTGSADYRETDAGGGWLIQFTVPGDHSRAFEVLTGDLSFDRPAMPLELSAADVHPAIVVDHIFGHLDDYVADRVIDPLSGQSGWVPPMERRNWPDPATQRPGSGLDGPDDRRRDGSSPNPPCADGRRRSSP